MRAGIERWGRTAVLLAVATNLAATAPVRVVDEQGNPVAGAKVRAAGVSPRESFASPWYAGEAKRVAVSDAGLTTVKGGAGGRVNVAASADGYAVATVMGALPPADGPVVVTMVRGRTVRGSVRRADGSAVVGMTVRADPVYLPLKNVPEAAVSGVTDDQGGFAIDHVAAGTYRVTIRPATSSDPAAAVFAEAAIVAVPVEADPPVTDLVARPAAVVRGRFACDRADQSLVNHKVKVHLRWPRDAEYEVNSDAHGAFVVTNLPTDAVGEIGFPDVGTDMAVAGWPVSPAGVRVDPTVVHFASLAAGPHDGLTAKIRTPATLVVDVVDAAGKPFGKADVAVGPDLRVSHTDDAGHAEIEVPPGVSLTVRAKDATALNWPATAGSGEPFQIAEGETTSQRLTAARAVDRDGGDRQVTGQVTGVDGKPAVGARVLLDDRDVLRAWQTQRPTAADGGPRPTWRYSAWGPVEVEADAAGRFTFNRLGAGKTTVWAASGGPSTGWTAFGEADDVETDAADLTVTLRPAVPAAATFAGTMTDPDGRPVPRADVSLWGGQQSVPERVGQGKTDDAGRFQLRADRPAYADFVPNLTLVGRDGGSRVSWRSVARCGGDRLDLRLLPDATATGRVVDERGRPVADARVYLKAGRSRDVGQMTFFRDMAAVAPDCRTAADGTYTLHGLPPGGRALVGASAAGYLPGSSAGVVFEQAQYMTRGPAMTPHVAVAAAGVDTVEVRPGLALPDLVLRDGATVEGTVRVAGGGTAAGAKVVFAAGYGREEAEATADGQGHFRLVGVADTSTVHGNTIRVTFPGDDYPTVWWNVMEPVYPGDRVTGIVIDAADKADGAAAFAAWVKQPGRAVPSRYRAAVVEAAADDSARGGPPADRLTTWDGTATPPPAYAAPRTAAVQPTALTVDPNDGAVYAVQKQGELAKFAADGHLLWRHADAGMASVAVDPDGGDLWGISNPSGVPSGPVVVLDRDGNKRAAYDLEAAAVAYDPHDRCFWAAGQKLTKLGRDGRVLAEGPMSFPFDANRLAVDAGDGWVWVGESGYADAGGVNRLWVAGPDGRPRRVTDLPTTYVAGVTVDAPRGVAWVLAGTLRRVSTADGKPVGDALPVAGPVAVEPDTGCAWIGTPAGVYRVDPDGRFVAFHPTVGLPRQVALIGGR